MLYRSSCGKIWDPTIIKYNGIYHCFTMHFEKDLPDSFSMRLATSADGVHWKDCGNVITDLEHPVWKMYIFRTKDGKFVLNHGSCRQIGGPNDTLRYYVSDDLLHWTFTGENHPDEQWYEPNGRWDHMYCIDAADGGYIGYVVAIPRSAFSSLLGIQRSDDGIHWHSCPPPVIDWDGVEPVREMEVGGCEKLGDKYYLMGGICPPFDGNYAYSCYVFTSDREDGPFRPDHEALRLCGFNGRRGAVFIQTLAAFCRDYDIPDGTMLLSNTVCYQLDEGSDNWLLPLREVRVDTQGHMRLHYFSGNDALKGRVIAHATDAEVATYTPEGWLLNDEYLLHPLADVDPACGAVIEGIITPEPWPARKTVRAGCWRPTMVGLYIEESETTGTALFAECANTKKRSIYLGTFDASANRFTPEDIISQGCASPTGLDPFVPHTFRLLIRHGMFEVYFDDMYVQTYTCANIPTGRINLALQNCKCRIENVTAYEMNL
ncbi:MAG: hypothetical protein IKM07_07770 [Clostridia bacterium]|nr:hypothetical protein [Clostridia bacterium]